jgi:hypothetical protein
MNADQARIERLNGRALSLACQAGKNVKRGRLSSIGGKPR